MSQAAQTPEVTSPAPVTQPTEAPKEEIPQEPVEGKEAPKEKDPADELKSKRFAELSKKEQKILSRKLKFDAEMKEKEASLAKREADIKEEARRELRELAKKNPTKAIEELGTSYKELTDYLLTDGKMTPEKVSQTVNEEIAALRKELEETKLSFKQQQELKEQQEKEKILKDFSANIVDTIKNNAEKYPAVHTFEGAPVIYEMIQKRFTETNGKHLMTIDEAAELLEKDLDAHVSKLLTTQKYASRLNPQPKKEETKPNSLNKPKTITNELTSSAPSLLPPATENDRIKRALEKLQS